MPRLITHNFYGFPPLLVLASLFLLAACASGTPLSDTQQKGKQLFIQNCGSCHATTADTLIVGPSLAGIASRSSSTVADLDARAYIEQSIVDPSAFVNPGYNDLMPKSFGNYFSDEELQSIIDYLMTLE
jgi:nitric oxide reductase subunit C